MSGAFGAAKLFNNVRWSLIENEHNVVRIIGVTGEEEGSEMYMELKEKCSGYWSMESDEVHAECMAQERLIFYVQAKTMSLRHKAMSKILNSISNISTNQI